MSGLWEKYKSQWPHLAWFIAAIIVMLDVDKIYEWAHQHELWGGVIAAIFTVILAWAQRRKSQGPGPLTPPQPPQGRAK